MTGLSPEELARRRPVWDALSDLFLDTETRWFMPHIARVLCDSGYSNELLERIWRYEMIPECGWNLAQVAGEWAAMPYDLASLERRAANPPSLTARLGSALGRHLLDDQWRAQLQLKDLLLPLPQEQRQGRVALWDAMLRAYLEDGLHEVLRLKHPIHAVRAHALSAEHARQHFHDQLRPIARGLLVAGETKSESRRAEQVEALIQRAFTQKS